MEPIRLLFVEGIRDPDKAPKDYQNVGLPPSFFLSVLNIGLVRFHEVLEFSILSVAAKSVPQQIRFGNAGAPQLVKNILLPHNES